jgi:hypothetical protein
MKDKTNVAIVLAIIAIALAWSAKQDAKEAMDNSINAVDYAEDIEYQLDNRLEDLEYSL